MSSKMFQGIFRAIQLENPTYAVEKTRKYFACILSTNYIFKNETFTVKIFRQSFKLSKIINMLNNEVNKKIVNTIFEFFESRTACKYLQHIFPTSNFIE